MTNTSENIVTFDELLRRRLADNTPMPDDYPLKPNETWTGTHHNLWPGGFPIISVEDRWVVTHTDAYDYGWLNGQPHVERLCRVNTIPWEVLRLLRDRVTVQALGFQHVRFHLAAPAGQADDEATRHVLAVIGYGSPYSFEKLGNPWGYVRVLLGCAHDYDTSGSIPSRGYHVGRCMKCGHRYVRDSGD